MTFLHPPHDPGHGPPENTCTALGCDHGIDRLHSTYPSFYGNYLPSRIFPVNIQSERRTLSLGIGIAF